MWSQTIILQILLTVAGFTQAQSPPGIFPSVPNLLEVSYGGQVISPGSTVPTGGVQSLPSIALPAGQASNNERYLFMMLDVDANGNNIKRANAAPAASAAAADANAQPTDPQHQNGQSTFLQALIQDYQFSGQQQGDGSTLLQQSSNGPANYVGPQPNSNTGHRYMMLLFDQPQGFQVPQQLQQAVGQRTTFDIKNFMQQAGLTLPRYANWFIVSNSGQFSNGGLGASVFTTAIPFTSTFTLPGGGISSFTGTSIGLTTANVGQFGQNSIVTYLTSTTFPNGGPTITYPTTSFAFGGVGFGSQPSTTTFTATTTFPNGGPTATYLTTSLVFNNGGINFNSGISTFYTTGFIGFTYLTSTSTATFTTTTELPNGALTSFRTTSATTVTRAFSGVSHISLSTYQTSATSTITGTGIINGQLTTYTSTSTSVGITTSAQSVNAAPTAAPNMPIKAALAVAGVALAYL